MKNRQNQRPSERVLRRLYVDQRLTTRAIADRYDVSKTSVVRWLHAAGIERRAASRGLDNRGLELPTAAELEYMVHVQHLSYRQIAKTYHVDHSAVPYWLTKHGIEPPTVWGTRRRGRVVTLPTEAELRHRVENRGESVTAIAASIGASRTTLLRLCHQYGVELRRDGWNPNRLLCLDGHEARSIYEQRVDDWLYQHNLEHECEPHYPWDGRYRADFLVGDTYIEVWGVTRSEKYKQRKAMKVARCRQAGLPLIQIEVWDFQRRWYRRLEPLLRQDVAAELFDGLDKAGGDAV